MRATSKDGATPRSGGNRDLNSLTTRMDNAIAEIAFTNSVGRGRNGWFGISKAHVSSFPTDGEYPLGHVHVNVVSKRPTFPGPIVLQLSPEDAKNLGAQLIRHSRQLLVGGYLRTKPRQSAK